jgi:hypothetical protein
MPGSRIRVVVTVLLPLFLTSSSLLLPTVAEGATTPLPVGVSIQRPVATAAVAPTSNWKPVTGLRKLAAAELAPSASGKSVVVPGGQFIGATDPHPASGLSPNAVDVPPPAATTPSAATSRTTGATSAIAAASGIQTTFTGLGTTGSTPSDSNMAPGPSNVVEQVNSRLAIYSRAGSLQQGPFSLQSWYGTASGDSVFDPHTIYEINHHHFITIAEDGTTKSWVVAVSRSSDATGAWCTYSFAALNSGASSVDFPLVGTSPTYLMLSIREGGSTSGTRLFLTPLTSVENCAAAGGWTWSNVNNPGGGVADTLTPVMDYSSGDTDSFLIDSYGGGGSDVSLYKISDTANPPSIISANVAVASYSVAPAAKQEGSSVVVDVGNATIDQAVNYSSGMYATLTTGYSGAAAIRWLKFNPSTQKLANEGTYFSTGLSYFYGSISDGTSGTTMYTYSLSGSSIYPSSAMLGMNSSDVTTSNTYVIQGSHPTPRTGTMTCGGTACSRWGDFTSTYTDPSNFGQFWSASQYMASTSSWGTVIAVAQP